MEPTAAAIVASFWRERLKEDDTGKKRRGQYREV
jgi:hypothetical protein